MDITKLKDAIQKAQEKDDSEYRNVEEEIRKFLTKNQVKSLYLILERKNVFIILKSIAKQYADDKVHFDLKLDILGEVLYDRYLQDEKIIKIFLAYAMENQLEAFVNFCDIINQYEIKL